MSHFRRFNLIEPKEMEVLSDLEAALHLTDDTSTTTPTSTATSTQAAAGAVASNNNSSSSVSSISNLNSNSVVTQALVSSPARSSTSGAASFDGVAAAHSLNSQIDVSVIVKQPLSGDGGASSLLNNNNDSLAKDRTACVVGTPPI
jgi:hypothetical protein